MGTATCGQAGRRIDGRGALVSRIANSHTNIDPRAPTMSGRRTSGFHLPGGGGVERAVRRKPGASVSECFLSLLSRDKIVAL